MNDKEKLKYNRHFEIIPSSKSQRDPTAKNKRGNSVPERHHIIQNEAAVVSDIITQEQLKPINHPHICHLANERPFSLSPTRLTNDKLLPDKSDSTPPKTLVLDLDETLVHSSFKPFPNSDIILQIEFEGIEYDIHVLVRPGVEEFITKMAKVFEIVIFTASLSKYAEPLLDIIDQKKNISHRLFREHCTCINGIYVKDLKKLNRELKDTIIVDNSPVAYAFNPDNGFPIKSWYDDSEDKELGLTIPILEYLSSSDDVRQLIPRMVTNSILSFAKAHTVMIELKGNRSNRNTNKEKENTSNRELKPSNEKAIKTKDIHIEIGGGASLKKTNGNIRLVNYRSKDSHNNDIQSLLKDKESVTTKNKLNTFKLKNCRNDFFCLNQFDLNTKKHQLMNKLNGNLTKRNNIIQSIKFNNLQNDKEKEKTSLQFFKLKIGKYTNLMEKKESYQGNNKDKLRPSVSAGVLRDIHSYDTNKKLVISPSTTFNTVNIPSLVNYSLYKAHYTNNKLNDKEKKTNIFKGFNLETPKSTHNELGDQPNSLQNFLKKINMAYTTRNCSINSYKASN